MLAAAHDEQERNVRSTGFVDNPEEGHRLLYELRRRRCPRSFALWGAHVAAVRTDRNWQGQPRLARLVGYSLRTCQRARVWFEARGLIRSELLEPGDRLPKQRAPVRRPMVVRYVRELQELGRLGEYYVPPHVRRKRTAAHRPEAPDAASGAMPASQLGELADAFLARYSASAPPSPPPTGEPTPKREHVPAGQPFPDIDQREIDEWDRHTRELEQSRGPPPRGS